MNYFNSFLLANPVKLNVKKNLLMNDSKLNPLLFSLKLRLCQSLFKAFMVGLETVIHLLVTATSDVQRLNAALDAVIENTDIGVFELLATGRITRINTSALSLLNLSQKEAVGKSFATFTADVNHTNQVINQLLKQANAQTWTSEFISPDGRSLGTRALSGIAMGSSPTGVSERILIWCGSDEHHTSDPDLALTNEDLLFSDQQRILGRDVERLRKKLGLSAYEFCQALGISATTCYNWRKKEDSPIKNRTAELHMRLLDRFPAAALRPITPRDLMLILHETLGLSISPQDLALTFGAEINAGYTWARGEPASEQVLALCRSLSVVIQKWTPSQGWGSYMAIVEHQAALEGTDLWASKRWAPRQSRDKPRSSEKK